MEPPQLLGLYLHIVIRMRLELLDPAGLLLIVDGFDHDQLANALRGSALDGRIRVLKKTLQVRNNPRLREDGEAPVPLCP